MFTTVAMDGNNQTLLIAFCLGVTHNVNSCTQFLVRTKEALREARKVSLITNLDNVIPFSLGRNIVTFVLVYMQIIYLSDFQQTFCQKLFDAPEVLANIDYTKWARPYFPNIPWNVLNIDILDILHGIFVQHGLMKGMLIGVLTPYVEMVLHMKMQKLVQWQATKIPSEIPTDIFQVFDF
uniref:Uncharacterized protein n=1 Tax=Lactuca sativa TaxID=4236 RepID=A0A9R1V7F8_LACSA|nr:hypothetical protein LSAT_V11C600307740 [Lactuca sativa]